MCDGCSRQRGTGSGRAALAVRFLILVALLLVPIVGVFATPAAFGADIGVMVNHNWIQISDFPPDTSVTVTVNDGAKGSETVVTDAGGFCQINWWEKGDADRPVPGDKVTAVYGAGPTDSVEMFVQSLLATVDPAADSVTGTARTPGGDPLALKSVSVDVHTRDWQTFLASASGTTDVDGTFTVSLPTFDLLPGQGVILTYWDAPDGSQSGNRTMVEVFNGIPSIGVMIDHNWIHGYDFPPGTSVTVSINGGTKGTETAFTDATGHFQAVWWHKGDENRPLPGDTITAVYGAATVEMVVPDIQAAADVPGDRIAGTAFSPGGVPLADRKVQVRICPPGNWGPTCDIVDGMVDANGDFALVLAPIDLVRGQNIWLTVWEAADGSPSGHQTFREVYNGIPALGAGVDNNWISGEGFPAGASVSLSVNGGAKGSESITVNSGGRFFVDWWPHGESGRPLPGDTIVAAYGAGSATMIVKDLQATPDPAGDRVAGTARTAAGTPLAGRRVLAQIHPPGNDWSVELASAGATVGGDGAFEIDLSPFDLQLGQIISVTLWDALDGSQTGNTTNRQIPNAIPVIGVMLEHNWINGEGFPPNSSVTVSVNGGAKGTETLTVDPGGRFSANWQPKGDANRPLAGDTVRAVSGDITVEMEVPTILAAADPVGNSVTGTAFDDLGAALAGRRVQVWIRPPGDWSLDLATAYTTVDGAGNFTLDLSPFDLVRGQGIWLTLWDAADGSTSGNQTMRTIYNGIPRLGAMIDQNWIRGNDFPPETDVTVALNSGAKGQTTVRADFFGSFHLNWGGIGAALQPGDRVTATYGLVTVEMLVQNVQASVDIVTNIVSGTAFDALALTALAGDKVGVLISPAWNQQHLWQALETVVGVDGSFSLNFTGVWDIQRGNAITLAHTSPEGHQTLRLPVLTDIAGRVTTDSGEPMPGVRVAVARELMDSDAEVLTDDNGEYVFRSLSVGAYKLSFDALAYNAGHGTNYLSEWHHDKPSFETADWVVVSPISGLQTVNAELVDAGGAIAGQVTGDGGAGLPDIYVCLQRATWTGQGPNCAALAPTAGDGTYFMSGIAPGDYRVLFYPGEHNALYAANYALKWRASLETIDLGQITQPVSVQLSQGGWIAGRIAGVGGIALPNIQVTVVDENDDWMGNTETDAAGNYIAAGIPPGNHKLHFSPDDYNTDHDTDYVAEWYHEAGSASPALVAVVVDETTPGISLQLGTGGRISGQVLGTGRVPLRAVTAAVFTAANGSASVGDRMTDTAGRYAVRGLAPGSYKVSFDPLIYNIAASADYLGEWFNNQAAFAAATVVAVGVGDNVAVNAQLNRSVNRPPVLTVACDRTTVAEGQAVHCTLTATDPDENILTLSADNLPQGSAFGDLAGTFDWTPGYEQSGVYDVRFAVTDNGVSPMIDEETVRISVSDVNRAPQLAEVGNQSVAEGQSLSFTLDATDPDGHTLAFAGENLPAGATLDPATGAFSWTPTYSQSGEYPDVRFTATDSGAPPLSSLTRTITISVSDVNRAPQLAEVGNQSVAEGQLLSFTLDATDPDGHTLAFAGENLPAGATLDPATGAFNWTPTYSQSGEYPDVQFTVTDDGVPPLSSPARSITISVAEVNRSPQLAVVGDQSISEGQLLTFTLVASDPDPDTLTFFAANLPAGASLDSATGVFRWTPTYAQSGEYANVRFTVTDSGAPPLTSPTQTVAISVANVNRAPQLDEVGNKSVAEGQALSFTLGATDPDGDALTCFAANLPQDATLDSAAGAFAWTPSYAQSGEYLDVSFRCADDGTPPLNSPTRTITITVTDVNRAPQLALIGDKAIEEGKLLSFTLSATDPDGDTPTFSGENLPVGATLDPATGVFRWTPSYSQSGSYAGLRFEVSDGQAADSGEITVTVTDHIALLFSDDFRDGNAAGDKHWTKNSGTWLVDARKTYQATSTLAPNLSTVKPTSLAPLLAGRIEAQAMMKALKPLDPNALVLFAFQSPAKYRYVQLVRGELRLGQAGIFGGVTTRIVARKPMALLPGANYQVRVDIRVDGTVWVFINGVVKIKYKFPGVARGGVGLGALKNGAQFDNFRVSDASVLP